LGAWPIRENKRAGVTATGKGSQFHPLPQACIKLPGFWQGRLAEASAPAEAWPFRRNGPTRVGGELLALACSVHLRLARVPFGAILKTPMIKSTLLTFAVVTGLLLSATAQAADKEELPAEVQKTIEALKKSDSGLKKFFDDSQGYAVFPSIAKGAIGIGGAHGKGQVFEKGKLAGDASLSQATIGFQLGGQVYSEVIFFETKDSLSSFKENKFAFSAQVSAVAAAEGASANAKYQNGVAVFTMAKGGLMYEASVGGQKFKFTPIK
jgi:lipid-binding SYLF domain-containing protein